MKKTLFLVFSGAIVIFSIICICSAPILNKVLIESNSWGTLNCKKTSDEYKHEKETTTLTGDDKDKYLKSYKRGINLCNRKKAVYGLEFSSLIIDVILGFICLILGLLHYFDVAKPFEKVTGIIGLATSIIGFILTLVYIIYSGYIFTNDNPELNYDDNDYGDNERLFKADNKGIFAKWDDNEKKYKCEYYDKDDDDAIYAKYNEMGKKIYNYDKDVSQAESTSPVKKCSYTKYSDTVNGGYPLSPSRCNGNGFLEYVALGETTPSKFDGCDDLYIDYSFSGYENKYIYDRRVTTIIFACFIIACDIGLAIFSFLLFKSDSSGL